MTSVCMLARRQPVWKSLAECTLKNLGWPFLERISNRLRLSSRDFSFSREVQKLRGECLDRCGKRAACTLESVTVKTREEKKEDGKKKKTGKKENRMAGELLWFISGDEEKQERSGLPLSCAFFVSKEKHRDRKTGSLSRGKNFSVRACFC